MSRKEPGFDPIRTLTDHADLLNAVSVPDPRCEVFYEIMSGALVWRDETTDKFPTHLFWALRFLRAYRTSLMLNAPRHELAPYWNHALALAPNWIGFLPSRRTPTEILVQIYRRGDISLRKCLRDASRQDKV